MKLSKDLIDKFYRNVLKTDTCWLWQGKPNAHGYGRMRLTGGVRYQIHRISWIIHNFKDIPKDSCVLHTCPGGDNTLCVNPDHLRLGSPQDNMRDRKERDGYARGDDHPLRKNPEKAVRGEQSPKTHFTENDIKKIRVLYSSGNFSSTKLAKMFKCSHSTILRVVHRKVWAHVH